MTAVQQGRILLVDDQEINIKLLEHMLRREGYEWIFSTTRSQDVVDLCRSGQPDLILLDLHMPHPDGFELLRQLRTEIADDFVPILVLTADITAGSRARALDLGAKDFLSKPFDRIEVLLRIRNLLETRHLYLAQRAVMEDLETRVRARTHALELAQVEMLERLARAADLRDGETGFHARRVGRSVALLADRLSLPEAEAALLGLAAPLHDVGKIGVPDSVLLKPEALSAPEFELVKLHTVKGGALLGGSCFPILKVAEEMALWHHERWDGSGYHKRRGDDIPLCARLVSVADVYDALVHVRPYKPAWEPAQALAELQRESGAMFEPRLVDAFVELARAGQLDDAALEAAS
ncbi:MAG: HD domain-containing phosphohydrolase [Dehalococcoidia bacterium]